MLWINAIKAMSYLDCMSFQTFHTDESSLLHSISATKFDLLEEIKMKI